jgi:phage gp29-like protein
VATPTKSPERRGRPRKDDPRVRLKRMMASFKEASTRVLLDWTPGIRRTAVAQADSGVMRLAADLCEAMLADDRIAGCLQTRVRGLMGLPLKFEAAGMKRAVEEAPAKALEADEDFWVAYPEAVLVDLLTWAVLLGVGVAEHVWVERSGRMLPTLRVWHPRWLRFDWPQQQWFLTQADGSEIPITPGDGKWVVCMPFGPHRPWARGAWRSLSLAWLSKYFAVHDWSRYSEVHGNPMPTTIAPEGCDDADWQEFARDLSQLGGRSAIGLPPGYDFKLVEAQANTFATFEHQIAWADTANAIILLGQNLTTEISRGSLAAAAIHQEIRHDIIRSDAETLSTTLREQSLRWWAEINFGDPELAPWPIWDTKPPDDKAKLATTYFALASSLREFRLQSIPVDIEALAQRFDLPLIKDAPMPPVLPVVAPGADAASQGGGSAKLPSPIHGVGPESLKDPLDTGKPKPSDSSSKKGH